MKINYRFLYIILSVVGLLFLFVFTEIDRREVLIAEFKFLYDFLLIVYLYTTVISFGVLFFIGKDIYLFFKKRREIVLFDFVL